MNCLIEKVLNNNSFLSRAWKDTRRNIDRYVLYNSHEILFSREKYREFLYISRPRQPMRIKKPYPSPLTRNACCCHSPKHLCFYVNFHLRNTSFQVVNQSELSNHNHHLPHLTRFVDIHLHIYTFMEIFTHALRHFKSSSNQRTRWY